MERPFLRELSLLNHPLVTEETTQVIPTDHQEETETEQIDQEEAEPQPRDPHLETTAVIIREMTTT